MKASIGIETPRNVILIKIIRIVTQETVYGTKTNIK